MSLFGGGSGSQYQLPGVNKEAKQATGDISTMYNNLNSTIPQFQTAVAGLQANPYGGQAQQGAQTASTMGQGLAQQGADNASSLYGMINSSLPYAQQILQTAFDPQQALYDRTLQQTQDQQRVGQASRGISMSPYGAGLENQALQNFNIDWQNNQLSRQTQGLGSYLSALSGYGTAGGQADQQAQDATNLDFQSASLPYDTYRQQGENNVNDIYTLAQAYGIPQTAIQDMLSYVGLGNQANSNAIDQNKIQNSMDGGLFSSGAGLLGGLLGM